VSEDDTKRFTKDVDALIAKKEGAVNKMLKDKESELVGN
jgi:ribosome recycling factor